MVKLERVGISGLKRLVALFGYRLTKSDEIDILSPLLARMLNNTDNFFSCKSVVTTGKVSIRFLILSRAITLGSRASSWNRCRTFSKSSRTITENVTISSVSIRQYTTQKKKCFFIGWIQPKPTNYPAGQRVSRLSIPITIKQSNIPTDCIITESVPCLSFARLLADYDIQNINLLQIDTEGYDVQILMNIDFDIIQPSIIHFEHGLAEGIMDHKTFDQVSERLRRYGYQILVEPYDATAYQLEIVGCTAPAHNQAI